MNSTVENILFDDYGVCNFCSSAKNRLEKEIFTNKENAIVELINGIKRKGKNSKYDCVIGVSGGVDSSYVAFLVKNYGLRPLAVHFDNGWNSELSVMNIETLLKNLNIDLYTHVVDWEEFKDLQLAFLKSSIANCEIPTDHAIVAILYKIAKKYNIKYIVHGGNLSTESIMPSQWMHDNKDLILLNDIHKKYGTKKLKTFPKLGYIKLLYYTFFRGIKYVGILNYLNYDKNEAIDLLESKFGWRKYEGKHFESIYTRFFQGYILPKKFNIDKRLAHYSSLIITNQMKRDEALLQLQESPYNKDKIIEDLNYICQKFNITPDVFSAIMSLPIK